MIWHLRTVARSIIILLSSTFYYMDNFPVYFSKTKMYRFKKECRKYHHRKWFKKPSQPISTVSWMSARLSSLFCIRMQGKISKYLPDGYINTFRTLQSRQRLEWTGNTETPGQPGNQVSTHCQWSDRGRSRKNHGRLRPVYVRKVWRALEKIQAPKKWYQFSRIIILRTRKTHMKENVNE